jgi:hypothetical protein
MMEVVCILIAALEATNVSHERQDETGSVHVFCQRKFNVILAAC